MRKGKILVVEPDDDIRNMLDVMLSNKDFIVTVAKNAREARELIPKLIPHLVIIEPDLPDGDGYDVLRDMYMTKSPARIPAIITKRDPLRAERLRGMEGYVHYLAKPFPPIDDFVLRIGDIVTLKGVLITRPINRITNLPNGVGVEERLRELVDAKRTDWAYIDIKIKALEAFSKIYGWQKGDEIIRKMGDLLREIVAQHGTEQDFIGHLGYDNFTICTHQADYDVLLEKLRNEFNKRISAHYSHGDIERGYTLDRQNQIPLMSLAISVLDMHQSLPKSFPEMIELVLRLRDGMDKDKPDDIATA